MSKLIIFTDGGARGNPGPAAGGVVIQNDKGEIISEMSKYFGIATNNQAEYQALVLALEKSKELLQGSSDQKIIECNLDSELVVNQLNGKYRIKNEGLKPLFKKISSLISKFDSVAFFHIPRDRNRSADKLVNRELDARE